MTRDQLRAARALLRLNQGELAALASVGDATVRRYESGLAIDGELVAKMRRAVEDAGAVLIGPGTTLGGTATGIGVALHEDAALPAPTRERLARAAEDENRPRVTPRRGEPQRPSGRPRKPRGDGGAGGTA